MLFDAELANARHEAVAIGFALLPNKVGVRRTEHDVDSIRPAFQNRRHRINHHLDALVRRKQAERQNDRPVAETELGLGFVRFDECELWNSVRDDLDFFVRDLINGPQQFTAFFGHDHDLSEGAPPARRPRHNSCPVRLRQRAGRCLP